MAESVLHCENFVSLLINLIQSKGKGAGSYPEILSSLKTTVFKLLEKVQNVEVVRRVDTLFQDTSHYFHSYLINLVKAYQRLEKFDGDDKSKSSSVLVRCISDAVMKQGGLYHPIRKNQQQNHLFTGFGMVMWFYEGQNKFIRPLNLVGVLGKNDFNCCDTISQALASSSNLSRNQVENLSRLFLSYSRITVNNTECRNCVEMTIKIGNLIISQIQDSEKEGRMNHLFMLLFFILETIIMHNESLECLSQVNFFQLVPKLLHFVGGASYIDTTMKTPFCIWSLKCVDLLLHIAKISPVSTIKEEILQLKDKLGSNLLSGFKIVRTITLSILRNLLELENQPEISAKFVEMCDKFISIEDMSILDPKFGPNVKSTLTEVKVLTESENCSEELKIVSL